MFHSDDLNAKHLEWKSRKKEFFDDKGKPISAKKLTQEQIEFKRSKYHPEAPVSQDICKTSVYPTAMHSFTHCVGMVLALLLVLIPKNSGAYKRLFHTIKSSHNYLENGNICASSTVLINVIHKLSAKDIYCVFSEYMELVSPQNIAT